MEETGLNPFVLDGMKEEDLPYVVEIENSSCAVPWSESLFFNELKNPKSIPLVARTTNGKVAGYLCASRIIDEGHILNLAVHPDFRKKGVASALIGEIVEQLRNEECRSIFLEVRISNSSARSIYERFGFTVLGIRKNYYGSPEEDALIMVLRLKET
jgi:[ribosomal protein S18]-alanine N-acetyltransferase